MSTSSAARTFDAKEIICKLMDARNEASSRFNLPLSVHEVKYLVDNAKPILASEPALLQLASPVNIVGSICGQFGNLLNYIKELGRMPDVKYLFLGDYQPGPKAFETICMLLALKIEFPEAIWFLRDRNSVLDANNNNNNNNNKPAHKSPKRAKTGGQLPNSAWDLLADIFDWFPVAAVVDQKVWCVNSGIPSRGQSLHDLANLELPIRVSENSFVKNLLLGTLHDANGRKPKGEHGFNEKDLHKFLVNNKLKFVVRSHDVHPKGYKLFSKRKCRLITIFSAFKCQEFRAAAMTLKNNLRIYLHIMPKSRSNLSAIPDTMYTVCLMYRNGKLVEDPITTAWERQIGELPVAEQYQPRLERDIEEKNHQDWKQAKAELKKTWIDLELTLKEGVEDLRRAEKELVENYGVEALEKVHQCSALNISLMHKIQKKKLKYKHQRDKIKMEFGHEYQMSIMKNRVRAKKEPPARKLMPGQQYREFRQMSPMIMEDNGAESGEEYFDASDHISFDQNDSEDSEGESVDTYETKESTDSGNEPQPDKKPRRKPTRRASNATDSS